MILGAGACRGPSPLRLLAAYLGLGCLVIVLHLLRPGLLVRLDLAVYDRLAAASPVRPPSGRVTLVEIDERTLAEAGRWPWPRDRVATLVDRVRSLGAVAIGLDLLFAEPDAAGEVSAGPGRPPTVPSGERPALSTRDAALATALARGPFVTGYAFYGRDVIVRTEERVGVRDDFLLTLAKQIVYSHHERWHGWGYPEGLRGEAIPHRRKSGRARGLLRRPRERARVEGRLAARGGRPGDRRRARHPLRSDMVDTLVRIQEEWRRIAVEFADEHDVDHTSAAGHRHETV
jgi:CHASE2 domain